MSHHHVRVQILKNAKFGAPKLEQILIALLTIWSYTVLACGLVSALLWDTAVSEPRVLTALEEPVGRTGRRVNAHICWFMQGKYSILDIFMQDTTSMRRRFLWQNYLKHTSGINKNKLLTLEITDTFFHHFCRKRAVSPCSSNVLFGNSCWIAHLTDSLCSPICLFVPPVFYASSYT